jgi:mono/diheme cytochrome c family protein
MRTPRLFLGAAVTCSLLAALAACARGGGPTPASPQVTLTDVRASGPAALSFVPLGGDRPSSDGSTVALARFGARTVALVADEDDAVLHAVDIATSEELSTTVLAGVPSQLVVASTGKVYVTLRDKDAVEVLEATGKSDASLAAIARIPTESEPVGIALSPDGATLVVACGWGHALTVHDAKTGARRARISLARDPRSVVVSDDGTRAFVSHVVGAHVSVVALADAGKAKEEPQVVSLDEPDGDDKDPSDADRRTLEGRRFRVLTKQSRRGSAKSSPRLGCQGFALAKSIEPSGRILAPQVLVDPGDTREPSGGYGSAGSLPAEVASIAVIDEGTLAPLAASLRPFASTREPPALGGECVLPRAAAVMAKTHSLFVACLGIDALVEYDSASVDPRASERRRFAVAGGPSGVALDEEGGRAVVWSQFDRALNVIDLEGATSAQAPRAVAKNETDETDETDEATKAKDAPDAPAMATERRPTPAVSKASPVVRIALARRASAPSRFDVALGRKLFHAVGDPRIASDGRACASCHPDGRDDSMTWATPDGPRQTPMLAGRLEGTAPYGWGGNGASVEAHLKQTFQRLRGSGLTRQEVTALVAYVGAMKAPPLLRVSASDHESAHLVARGRKVFEDPVAECASCHSGKVTADGARHSVASKTKSDATEAFNTPSLRGISGTAPYFHDGRYATLRDLLHGADGTMGHTSHLSENDVDALEAYLRSL